MRARPGPPCPLSLAAQPSSPRQFWGPRDAGDCSGRVRLWCCRAHLGCRLCQAPPSTPFWVFIYDFSRREFRGGTSRGERGIGVQLGKACRCSRAAWRGIGRSEVSLWRRSSSGLACRMPEMPPLADTAPVTRRCMGTMVWGPARAVWCFPELKQTPKPGAPSLFLPRPRVRLGPERERRSIPRGSPGATGEVVMSSQGPPCCNKGCEGPAWGPGPCPVFVPVLLSLLGAHRDSGSHWRRLAALGHPRPALFALEDTKEAAVKVKALPVRFWSLLD